MDTTSYYLRIFIYWICVLPFSLIFFTTIEFEIQSLQVTKYTIIDGMKFHFYKYLDF